MTSLLVSVRDVDEAKAALAGGADIIDIKEPNRGSLGAATPEVVQSIVEFVDGRVPVSVAMGELAGEVDLQVVADNRLAFAKVGLAGCRVESLSSTTSREWQAQLLQVWSTLQKTVEPVAVGYADWELSLTPSPKEIIRFAAGRAKFFLLDTYDKSQSLQQHVHRETIDDWFEFAKAHNMSVVVAGSVALEQVKLILSRWQPRCIAVRGAVCRMDRTTAVCEQKVREFKRLLERSHFAPKTS